MSKKSKDAEAADKLKYGQAVAEIEQILESIDKDEVDVDDLSQKVERAVQLIRLCQEKLRATEMKVTKVLAELKSEDEEEDVEDAVEDDPAPEADSAGSTSKDEDDELPF